MEHNDDAIIIIVGDENDKISSHLSSKETQEVLNETTDRTLDNLKNTVIMNEAIMDDTEEFLNEEFLSESQRWKHKKLERNRCRRSFVNELRQRQPELAKDGDLLIGTLAEIMRRAKPPPPPQDHFIMNGVLFECIGCSGLFANKSDVGRHYQDLHGPRYLTCFSCGLKFRRGTNLYGHEKCCKGPDRDVVLRARAISVGNRGRHRPYLNQAKQFRQVEFSRTNRKTRSKDAS